MKKKRARRIVNAIFSELEGRGGFDILNEIHDDTETYNDMYNTCVDRVVAASDDDANPKEDLWYPTD